MTIESFEQRVADFLADHPESEFGPAHVVLGDFNFDVDFIESAINQLMCEAGQCELIQFLRWMLTVPEQVREAASAGVEIVDELT